MKTTNNNSTKFEVVVKYQSGDAGNKGWYWIIIILMIVVAGVVVYKLGSNKLFDKNIEVKIGNAP